MDPRGAEIQLADDVTGYLRASEISRDRVEDARNVLKEGDDLSVMVINVDRKARSIQLSIKAKDVADQQEAMQRLSQSNERENAGTTSLGALLRAAQATGSAHLFAPAESERSAALCGVSRGFSTGTTTLAAHSTNAATRSALDAPRGTLVTKRVLRQAFADVLSPDIVSRPKASFPLPFEQWIAARADWIDGPVSREVFTPAARALVRTQAAQHWRLAWPMLNLARWLDTVFA